MKIPFPARVVLSLFVALAGPLVAAEARPNILFVFVDDSGWGDYSCYGNPIKDAAGKPITPNIDRIAATGTRFTQGYVLSLIHI